jgi:hypothetical protein
MVPSTKGNTRMARNTVKASLPSLMVAATKVSSNRTKYQGLGSTSGPMVKLTLENGRKTKCMEMERYHGKMESTTRVRFPTINVKVVVSLRGKTDECTKGNGKTESNTVLVRFPVMRALLGKENGKMAKK